MRSLFGAAAVALVIGSAVPSEADPIRISESAFGAGSTLVTFSEVPLYTAADGLTIGNATFDWTGPGSLGTADVGPGNTNNIDQPSLLSEETFAGIGILTISLSNYISMLGYGYAISTQSGTVINATTISLFDNSTLLGSLSFTGVSDPSYTGGFAGVQSDVMFNRVQVTFGGANAFALDDLRTSPAPVPEPASMLLLGTGLLGVGVRRWRQNRA